MIKWLWAILLIALYVPLVFVAYLACWGTADMMLQVLRTAQAVSSPEDGAIENDNG